MPANHSRQTGVSSSCSTRQNPPFQPFSFMPSLSRPLSRARSAAFRASYFAPTCKDAQGNHHPPSPAPQRARSIAQHLARCWMLSVPMQAVCSRGTRGQAGAGVRTQGKHTTPDPPPARRCAPYLPRVARSRQIRTESEMETLQANSLPSLRQGPQTAWPQPSPCAAAPDGARRC